MSIDSFEENSTPSFKLFGTRTLFREQFGGNGVVSISQQLTLNDLNIGLFLVLFKSHLHLWFQIQKKKKTISVFRCSIPYYIILSYLAWSWSRLSSRYCRSSHLKGVHETQKQNRKNRKKDSRKIMITRVLRNLFEAIH